MTIIKITEGWHNTRQGAVFVDQSGVGWVVRIWDNKFVSIPVRLTPSDIIGKSALERRVLAIRQKTARSKQAMSTTSTPQ